MKWKAKWIWCHRRRYNQYNDAIAARTQFRVPAFRKAEVHITADTFYRLYINDVWVNDGPARAWPEHFSYDSIDISAYLKKGLNEIKIIARYFGVGDFHHVPQQAGLLAQIDITAAHGKVKTIPTDSTWQAADYRPLLQNTPKASIQMEPAEFYDARAAEKLVFHKATVLFPADGGPWQDLTRRKVPLLNRKEIYFTRFLSAQAVEAPGDYWCLPFRNLIHPRRMEANRYVHCPFILTSILHARKKTRVQFDVMDSLGNRHSVFIDGKSDKTNSFHLSPGKHMVLLVWNQLSHITDISLRLIHEDRAVLRNPIQPNYENPWCFIPFQEYAFVSNDRNWLHFMTSRPELAEKVQKFQQLSENLVNQSKTSRDVKILFGNRAKLMPSSRMFARDHYHRFISQQPLLDVTVPVDNPAGLIHENPEITTVYPSSQGTVQLWYDLGRQSCGYYHFELTTEENGEIDLYGVEYLTPDGQIQHTLINRNGMTYITQKGLNRYVSLKRRSGRYIFITLRNFRRPVQIRRLGVIESLYPAEYQGAFTCSDESLNRIWDISARTLELCMEDTFTDCPLYEQTLWVGDARNESLFAYTLFGGSDIARNSIEITAQSLERFPITGCQVPSGWDCLLPAWSFLWGISVWEHYWYTGDAKWLRKLWPAVLKNLQGAFTFIDKNSLFTADFWNFFDWARIDQDHECVLHNSMFLIGAIDAAVQCAATLQKDRFADSLKKKRRELTSAINQLWDKKRKCYPDSIHEDGTVSPSASQHTSFLSLLYDIVPARSRRDAIRNIVNPPPQTTCVGSPFAMMFLFEAMEKLGMEKEIIQSIQNDYTPMLRLGATTVWESFARGTLVKNEFPTRSHCHAWSSAPVYFLSRIILGLRPTSPGCRDFELSPHPLNLQFAHGSVATPLGPVSVQWQREGRTMNITCQAPKEIQIHFKRNDSLRGLSLKMERK